MEVGGGLGSFTCMAVGWLGFERGLGHVSLITYVVMAESQSDWKGIGPAQIPGVGVLTLPRGGEAKKSHDKRLGSREE